MEKIKLLLYCTKSKPYLMNLNTKYFVSSDRESLRYIDKQDMKSIALNGKIVAKCDYECEKIKWENIENYNYEERLPLDDILDKSCLTKIELEDYLCGNNGYAIHIKNLNIFDKPRELNEYGTEISPIFMKPICYAPQNMMSCIDTYDNQYILISIHPEWLCKILNGEKTIEVRKKVLKEMMQNA